MIGGVKSARLRTLCAQVLNRLPDGWDEYRTFQIEESDNIPVLPSGNIGYATALREEEAETHPLELPEDIKPEQIWIVTLYEGNLAQLSDAAVRWAIAHELGHVASGLRTGSITLGGVAMTQFIPGEYHPADSKDDHEDSADKIALDWGFSEELQAFLSETQ